MAGGGDVGDLAGIRMLRAMRGGWRKCSIMRIL